MEKNPYDTFPIHNKLVTRKLKTQAFLLWAYLIAMSVVKTQMRNKVVTMC